MSQDPETTLAFVRIWSINGLQFRIANHMGSDYRGCTTFLMRK